MSGPLEEFRSRIVARLQRGGRYPTWVLVVALTGMFATTFPVTILTVSLGEIAVEFETSETVLAWVISAPMLASALALPILGKMGDLYGHRRVFVLGFGFATATAALTATAWDASSLIGFRTLSQVIGAATQPTAMALVVSVFPEDQRVKALGWWSFVTVSGPAVGLIAGGPLVELVGWRVIFLLQATFAAVVLVASVLVLSETTRRARVRFDVLGAVTLALAAGGVMVFLSQGAEIGWDHPVVVAGLAIAPVAVWLFIRAERTAPDPLLPLPLFRERNFAAPIIGAVFMGAAYMGGFVLTPLLLRFVLGYSLSETAFLMVLRPLTFSLSSPLGGTLGMRIGERPAAMLGTAMMTVSLAMFSWGALGASTPIVLVALVLQGVGNGVSRPSLTAVLTNAVGDGNVGIAAASQRMVHQIGASFGIAVMTIVYGGVNQPGPFARAYVVGAICAAVSLVAASFVVSTARVPEHAGEVEALDVATAN